MKVHFYTTHFKYLYKTKKLVEIVVHIEVLNILPHIVCIFLFIFAYDQVLKEGIFFLVSTVCSTKIVNSKLNAEKIEDE